MLFAHSTSPLPEVLASQDTGRHQTWRAYAPRSGESSLPSLTAVGGLCLEISLVTWGADPVLYQLFAIQNRRSFPIRKKKCRNWSGSHVPGKTSRRRPPTALKLGSEDSQLSGACADQVWWRPVSCEARTCGSGEVLCAKSTFFPVLLNRTREARALRGFQHHKGITCFVFCFLGR